MNQLLRIWKSLSNVQRISLVLVPLLLSAIAFAGLRWKHDADFRTLYSSLTPEDASAVTQKIKEAGIEYRLDETGATVTVPAARLAEARLALAGAGMPRSGRIGFELFDRTNLGASDFTEQVNYQRALEGELERTVATLSEVDQARIHITAGKESVFLDARQPAKATVVLKLRSQGRIQQSSVTAIANLVASAVDGLSPEAVSIIDDSGRLLNRPRPSDGDAKAAEVNLDYRQQLEAELQAKLTGALEPLLGAGKFRTGVNIDCDFTSVDQSDEIYDSTNAAMLTSQVTEESTGGGVAAGGQPGTASNLPSPPPKSTAGAAGVVRRTENNSYQPSRTVRHTVNPKGTIRKISTIVLLDHAVRWEGTGAKAKKIDIPPSAEVVKAVHDVVAGIVAFNEPRGDQITVESLPFESTLDAEPPMSATPLNQKSPAADKKQQMMLLGGGALVVVILLGGALFVMRRSTKSKATNTAATAIAGDPNAAGGVPLVPGQPEGEVAKRIREGEQEQARLEAEVLSAIKLPAATKTTEVLIRHIRESTHKDPATAANVLRAWMNDSAGNIMTASASGMMPAVSGVRKAAILLILLGEENSAPILREFNEVEVQQVAREIAHIDNLTSEQAEAALEEFYQMSMGHEFVVRGGLDYARRMLHKAFGPDAGKKITDRLVMMIGGEYVHLDVLQKADPQQLARFIHTEHPQTIALVLSHLNASSAAGLLSSLPPDLRPEVALRMANLDEITPEIVNKIAKVIGEKLQVVGQFSRESYGGVRAIAELFNQLDTGTSKEILDVIDAQNPNLVEAIRQLMFVFEDLLSIDVNQLKEILGRVDRKILTVALKGTSAKLREHFFSTMSPRGIEMLKDDIEALGPVKIKDVEGAQQQIITTVRQLESEGVISLKGGGAEQYVV